jgi:hypothetical protein
MIPQTQLTLQSYFQTGDVPTQAQYLELIGTMFYLYNALNTSVNNAVAQINAATAAIEAIAPQVLVRFTALVPASTPPAIIGAATNVASITNVADKNRLTFTVPFANTNYKVFIVGGTVATLNANWMDISAANAANVVLVIWN